jgi:hypothetical protein
MRVVKPNYVPLMKFRNHKFLKFTPMRIGVHPLYKPENYEFITSYNNLPIDPYHMAKEYPTRFRRYANYTCKLKDRDVFEWTHNPEMTYNQDVIDDRGKPRLFEDIERPYIYNHWVLQLLTQSVALALVQEQVISKKLISTVVNKVSVDLHQVRQLAYPRLESHNSPEGIHRDGASYIVSAFVVNRANVGGGESIIYDENKKEEYETILKRGHGMFMEDKVQYHYVEPIHALNNCLGFRDILGIDIKIHHG